MSAVANEAVKSTSLMVANSFVFYDHFICRKRSLVLGTDGYLLIPDMQRVEIKRSLELVWTAVCFGAQRSPVNPDHRVFPPFFSSFFSEHHPCAAMRIMLGCVSTVCLRFATAPKSMLVTYRTSRGWAEWVMDRVTRGHVSRVQVLRIEALAVLCAMLAFASRVLCV